MVDPNRKIDSLLNKKIEEYVLENIDEHIDIIGKCNSPISSKMISELELNGIQLKDIIHNIFEGSVPASKVKKIAALDHIISLELKEGKPPI